MGFLRGLDHRTSNSHATVTACHEPGSCHGSGVLANNPLYLRYGMSSVSTEMEGMCKVHDHVGQTLMSSTTNVLEYLPRFF
jgi:hypothetical protein